MTVFNVLHYPHVLLKKKSTKVEHFTEDLKEFVETLTRTMYAFDGGGIAAPQVGILKRIVILDMSDSSTYKPEDFTVKINGIEIPSEKALPLKLINPEIIHFEDEFDFPYDGCLSLPGLDRGVTRRYRRIRAEALTVDQEIVEIVAEGIIAVCMQHEIDHLDGIVFIERSIHQLDDKLVVNDIKDYEDTSTYRRMIKKLKPIDPRRQKYSFL